MKKNQVELKRYLAPKCEVIRLENESSLLAGSEINHTIEVGDNNEENEDLEFE